MKIAICDDDKIILDVLESIVTAVLNKKEINYDIRCFHLGNDLINFIKYESHFDLIFLDIELGTTTGIIIGDIIRNEISDNNCKIVFMTAKDGYEGQLFDFQPFNLIRKPFKNEKVEKCLNLAMKVIEEDRQVFRYRNGTEISIISTKDIIYFEKVGRKVRIVTTEGEETFYDSISNITSLLPANFISPHKSYIINKNKVTSVKREFIIMNNNHFIPISKANLSNVKLILFT